MGEGREARVSDGQRTAGVDRAQEGLPVYRDLFTIPGLGFTLHGFGLLVLLGCFGALQLTAWRARRERLDPEDVYGLAVWLFTGGVIGARLFYVLQHHETIHRVADIFRVWQGGIVFYGCIIGGLIGSILFWQHRRFPFLPMADAVAPAVMVGVALGRLGCFCNGCCFGAVSRAPWALTFPARSGPWVQHVMAGWIPYTAARSLPVHPTQLYAALDGFLILGLLTWFFPKRRRDGEVMALLMLAYPIARFVEESLRADEGPFLAGLTISQDISVVLLACGVAFWAWITRQPVGRFRDRFERRERMLDARPIGIHRGATADHVLSH